ncbi:hypothetical protein GCM10010492_47700 [Saccharothrix mutabilis subsp. mutabilis]|uniref:DUF4209 domain-containing protein n=1 Tax=Saccharothrix mutabilis subsp. mutabilis TaxID=66855 RepID=A0ABN0U984_9PSEU
MTLTDDTTEMAGLLDSLGTADSLFEIESRLSTTLSPITIDSSYQPGANEARTSVAFAFNYKIKQQYTNGTPRLTIEGKYQDSFGTQTPPPIKSLPDSLVDHWVAISSKVSAPYARARLEHLLFARGHGNARDHALAAIEAYRRSASQWKRSLDQVNDLTIALRLSRSIGSGDIALEVMGEMLAAASSAIESSENLPGVALRLIKPIVFERMRPNNFNEVVEAVKVRYEGDPWISDEMIELQLQIAASSSEKTSLEAARVEIWLSAAEASSGLVRVEHTRKALEVAEKLGRKDLIDRAASALQRTDPEDLEFMRFSATAHLSEQQIDEYLAPIIDAPDWRTALRNFASFGPLSGDYNTNLQAIAQQAAEFPLQALMPPHIYGGDGLPRFFADTEERRQQHMLSNHESRQIAFQGPWIASALYRIPGKHGFPSEAAITAHFAERHIVSDVVAGVMARSHIRYWTGDYEGAMFSISPMIEALARKLAIDSNSGVYRLQRQESPGQYPGLGSLLSVLRDAGLDISWYRYLHTLCSNISGMNTRNEIAHGFIAGHDAVVAALLLQAAGFLSLLKATADPDPAEDSTDPSAE